MLQPAFHIAVETECLANFSVQFLRRHVRMEDVRRYLADALIMYGSLADFAAAPRPGAVCYSGDALLAQFGFPFDSDRELIGEAYPWLANFTQPGCPEAPSAGGAAGQQGGGGAAAGPKAAAAVAGA